MAQCQSDSADFAAGIRHGCCERLNPTRNPLVASIALSRRDAAQSPTERPVPRPDEKQKKLPHHIATIVNKAERRIVSLVPDVRNARAVVQTPPSTRHPHGPWR